MATDQPTDKSGEGPNKHYELRLVYLKDVSFEAPHVPGILFGHEQPELVFGIETNYGLSIENHEGMGDVFDVLVTVNVEATAGGRPLFLIEVHQGGLFEVGGYSAEETDVLLRTTAAESLFPYARELVTSLIARGGFPNVRLRPLNFAKLYAEQNLAGKQAGAN
ncbi:MAG: protein-export chaperone SecB [Gammaproteobacteria bacterium]|nr:protein-export chaperone SecB [Gammaproteobacteria bacterium]